MSTPRKTSQVITYPKGLTRKRGSLTGVCGGLARYLKVNPAILRLGFIALTPVTSGLNILAYFALAFWLPKEPPESELLYIEGQEENTQQSVWQQIGLSPREDTQVICSKCDTVSRPFARYCHRCGNNLFVR